MTTLIPGASPASDPGPGKALRSLSALMRDIAEARAELMRREAAALAFEGRLHADLDPLESRMLALRLETFRVLGAHLRSGRLNRRAAKRLELALYHLAEALERDSGLDLEADRARIFEDIPAADPWKRDGGSDSDEEDGTSQDAFAAGGYRESDFTERPSGSGESEGARSGAGRRAGGHGPADREAAKDQAIAGDIRALYLMLARALHPDKEADPSRLAEKTAWMQKVTAAYAARDLARLLDILAANPLDAVGPYLSQAPLKTVQGFAKRLRRDLAGLRARLAAWEAGMDPFLSSFLKEGKVNEAAYARYVAEMRKHVKFMKQRLDAYKTARGVEELAEALRDHGWDELM